MDLLDIIFWLLPQNPLLGPPLPAGMDIFWQEPVKPEPPSEPPAEDFDILAGLVSQKRYVTRVTVRKCPIRRAK